MTRRRTRRTGIAALTALVAVTAGCGSDAEQAGGDPPTAEGAIDVPSDQPSEYLPSATPSAGATMTEAPADYTGIEGEGFTISAPGDFQQQRETSSNGEPMLVLELPSAVGLVPQRVAVVRDVEPESSAAEQSFALEASKSAGGPAAGTTRVQVEAPETQSAYLTTWREDLGGSEVTYWQLMQQVSPALILNVVAFAPSSEFEASEVSTILRTFQADSPE